MTAAVVFFSHAGENFINGSPQRISIGNTEVLARKIAKHLKLDLFKLEEVETYPVQYDETVRRAEIEKKERKRVAYHIENFERSGIRTLFLGYPNWWGTYPRVISSFLDDLNTDDLIIYPFCTHEGSAFGSSIDDLITQCPKAQIKNGLPVRGSRVERSDVAVENWLLSYK